jgi:hypothetical protein
MALDPDNATAGNLADDFYQPVSLAEAVIGCVETGGRGFLECVQATMEAILYSASSLVTHVFASYLQMRYGVAFVSYQVYCCNGPAAIEVGDDGTWRAAVVEGTARTPFTFIFDWGDGEPTDWLNANTSLDQYGLSMSHRFQRAGRYEVKAEVRDADGHQIQSNATVTGPTKPYFVEVYGTESSHSERSKLRAGTQEAPLHIALLPDPRGRMPGHRDRPLLAGPRLGPAAAG